MAGMAGEACAGATAMREDGDGVSLAAGGTGATAAGAGTGTETFAAATAGSTTGSMTGSIRCDGETGLPANIGTTALAGQTSNHF